MELKDINSPSLNDSSLPPMPCCVRLACKSMMYRSDERPGLLHFSDTPLPQAVVNGEEPFLVIGAIAGG